MKPDGKRYTVSQMANICNVSAKQLRYYDNSGILGPAFRDEETGYRYYTDSQIEEVLLLNELRELGFPLQSIGTLLNHRDLDALKIELEAGLHRARAELDEARRKYDRTVDILLRTIHGAELIGRAGPCGIKLVEVPPRSVVFTRYVSYWNVSKLFIERRAELFRIAEKYRLHTVGANMAIFHNGYLKQFSSDPRDSEGDLEICIGTDTVTDCPNCRKISGFSAVSATHVGRYRDMEPCYLQMEQWAKKHGVALSGLSLEEYTVGATMTNDPADYVTKLYLPVKGSIL